MRRIVRPPDRLPIEAPRLFSIFLALSITIWFLTQSCRGLSGDDIMNICRSCEASWTRLLTANLYLI